MAAPIKIAIAGALGRMGQVVSASLAQDDAFQLAGRFDRPDAVGEGLVGAEEAMRMGIASKVCEPDDLLPEARRHAEILASRSIPSLVAVKKTMVAPYRDEIAAATARENAHFQELLGGVANAAAT